MRSGSGSCALIHSCDWPDRHRGQLSGQSVCTGAGALPQICKLLAACMANSLLSCASCIARGEHLGYPKQCRGPVGAVLSHVAWQDLPDVLQRAADAGVAACIVTGCSRASSLAAQSLCRRPGPLQLYFTAGASPTFSAVVQHRC